MYTCEMCLYSIWVVWYMTFLTQYNALFVRVDFWTIQLYFALLFCGSTLNRCCLLQWSISYVYMMYHCEDGGRYRYRTLSRHSVVWTWNKCGQVHNVWTAVAPITHVGHTHVWGTLLRGPMWWATQHSYINTYIHHCFTTDTCKYILHMRLLACVYAGGV